MKHFILPIIVTLLVSYAPLTAHAQPANFAELVNMVIGIINPLIVLILGGILLVFLFGLTKFLFSLGDAKSIEEGKQLMFWGVVGLFVALSFWGLVAILTNTFLRV